MSELHECEKLYSRGDKLWFCLAALFFVSW